MVNAYVLLKNKLTALANRSCKPGLRLYSQKSAGNASQRLRLASKGAESVLRIIEQEDVLTVVSALGDVMGPPGRTMRGWRAMGEAWQDGGRMSREMQGCP